MKDSKITLNLQVLHRAPNAENPDDNLGLLVPVEHVREDHFERVKAGPEAAIFIRLSRFSLPEKLWYFSSNLSEPEISMLLKTGDVIVTQM